MINTLRSFFWIFYLRLRGASIGKKIKINGPLKILLRDNAKFSNIKIGDYVTFGGTTYIRLRKNGKIIINDGVTTATDVWFVGANDSELSIGKYARIGSYCIFNGGHGIKVGDFCTFASFVYVHTSDHNFKKGKLIQAQGFFGSPISIGNDVWIGGHVFINKGINIGSGSVIGAGAVVIKDLPENSISVGNPAKVIKYREE